MKNILFTGLVLFCCGYSIIKGGRDGRTVSAMFILAGLVSIPAGSPQEWTHTNVWALLIDVLLLIGLARVALQTQFYWPVWMVGLHIGSIATHFATVGVKDLDPDLYFSMQSFWSLPELIIMAIGIAADRRAGIA
ncbi:hypothetical protein [Sphingobium subterraneum]|uniref:Uncharacterized protein n=1 Tax=Sphingobium subterraneum TaxID=627688 RepID=A0A841IYT2_9SPHN|nr:hypothetical protein [Sphingobium subterraneum]MBB6122436.1 hypothetical protein [Sphingobium subterraneum]